MPVIPLEPTDHASVQTLLRRDPVVNIFPLGMLEQTPFMQPVRGYRFYGVRKDRWYARLSGLPVARTEMTAVAMVGARGTVVPWSHTTRDAAELGRHLQGHCDIGMLVGPREACDALWEAFAPGLVPRCSYDQRLYTCEETPKGPSPRGFRLARKSDLDVLVDFSARMMIEDLGYDPSMGEPAAFRASVRQRIERGVTWVVEESGELIFKIDVGAACQEGVTVGGTYVPTAWRGRGVATLGMRALARVLLQTHPLITLHVNEANTPAVRCYESAGFTRDAPFRLNMIY